MAIYTAPQVGNLPFSANCADGNTYLDDASVTTTAALAASGDEVQILKVPRGIRLTDLKIRNTALGAGLDGTLGYVTLGSKVQADAPSFFSASFQQLRTASTGYVDVVFDPITFEDDTLIVFRPTAAGTGTGTIKAKAMGKVVGSR